MFMFVHVKWIAWAYRNVWIYKEKLQWFVFTSLKLVALDNDKKGLECHYRAIFLKLEVERVLFGRNTPFIAALSLVL